MLTRRIHSKQQLHHIRGKFGGTSNKIAALASSSSSASSFLRGFRVEVRVGARERIALCVPVALAVRERVLVAESLGGGVLVGVREITGVSL
jgi:hypothetical protein